MSASKTNGHPSHASENLRRSRLLQNHLGEVRSFRMNPKKVDHSGHLYLLTFFAPSTPLGCPPINLGWGPIVKGLVKALLIVEPEIGRQA
jgi:hypothetical protein